MHTERPQREETVALTVEAHYFLMYNHDMVCHVGLPIINSAL